MGVSGRCVVEAHWVIFRRGGEREIYGCILVIRTQFQARLPSPPPPIPHLSGAARKREFYYGSYQLLCKHSSEREEYDSLGYNVSGFAILLPALLPHVLSVVLPLSCFFCVLYHSELS